MEITWYGHSCIRMMERGVASIVADPFDESIGYEIPPRLSGDIVTISHIAPGHSAYQNVKHDYVLETPGEYEIGGVFINAVATHNPTVPPEEAWRNVVFVYDFDGLIICHLGDLNHVPDQKMIEAFGNIDVLLVPVGGGNGLTSGQAAEVISLIEPGIVVPMHYQTEVTDLDLDPVEKFLKEMGVSNPEAPEEILKVRKSTAEIEETQVVLLDWRH